MAKIGGKPTAFVRVGGATAVTAWPKSRAGECLNNAAYRAADGPRVRCATAWGW